MKVQMLLSIPCACPAAPADNNSATELTVKFLEKRIDIEVPWSGARNLFLTEGRGKGPSGARRARGVRALVTWNWQLPRESIGRTLLERSDIRVSINQ